MSVSSDLVPGDLFTALAAIPNVDSLADTKAPDGYVLPLSGEPSIVYYLVSDVPDTPIRGQIAQYQQRWTIDLRGLDLTAIRTIRRAVITALHGLTTGSIQRCDYEGPAPILFEEADPGEYHCPIDFLLFTT